MNNYIQYGINVPLLVLQFGGLIAFILIACLVLLWMLRRSTKPSISKEAFTTRNGDTYFIDYQTGGRNQFATSSVSIPATMPVDFVLEKEGRARRLAQWFGFAHKFHTGDSGFDEQIYIDSDDPKLCGKFQNNLGLRNAVLELFQRGAKSVSATSSRLSVAFKDTREPPTVATIDAVVPMLIKIRDLLPDSALSGARPENIAVLQDAAKRYKSATVFFCFGAMIAYVVNDWQSWLIVNPFALFFRIMEFAIAMFALGLIAVQCKFRHSALGYDVLKIWMITGGIGCIVCSAIVTCNIDVHCDRTQAVAYIQSIISKDHWHGRHHTYYKITVDDWHGARSYTLGDVSYSAYSQARPGERLKIYAHPGYLGAEWIERYQVIPK